MERGSHRLELEDDVIEARGAERRAQPPERELVVGLAFRATKVDRAADDDAAAQITELGFGGRADRPHDRRDQIFEREIPPEDVRLMEQPAREIRLHRLNEPSMRARA